jgi:hypothetical protein
MPPSPPIPIATSRWSSVRPRYHAQIPPAPPSAAQPRPISSSILTPRKMWGSGKARKSGQVRRAVAPRGSGGKGKMDKGLEERGG